jgi:ABC-type multidrug transport system fused ATPase/permease subunit
MSLDALIMLVGALVAIMPCLGFTIAMQMWIIFVLGVIVIALGIAVRRRGERQRARRRGEFVESIPAEPARRSGKAREAVENNREDDSING